MIPNEHLQELIHEGKDSADIQALNDYCQIYVTDGLIHYVDQSDIKKLQEILKSNGIDTGVYYTETNAFERGAGDYHENFLLAILTGAREKIGGKIISIILEKFRPFQRVGINSINTEELIAYISQQTDINKKDLHMKSVKEIEDEEIARLHQVGIRGICFNLYGGFDASLAQIEELSDLIRILYDMNPDGLIFGTDLPYTRVSYRFSREDIELI